MSGVVNPSAGFVRLADSGALGSVASYILDSISSTVNFLRVSGEIRPATDGAAITFIFRKGAGTDITSYDVSSIYTQNAVVTGANAAAQASIAVGVIENTSPQGVASFTVEAANIQSSDRKSVRITCAWFDSGTGKQEIAIVGANVNDTAALTGIKVIASSGNLAAGRIYTEGAV